TLLGTAPVIEGMATLSVSFGTPGAHAVRAEYSGDANNIGLGSAGTVDFSVSTPPAPGGSGTTATYQYDRVGNTVVRTDPRGYSQHTVYDAADRPLMDINAVGGVRQQRYNGLGLPVLVSDADGVGQQTIYDNFGRVNKKIDGFGNAKEYSFDLPDGSFGSLDSPTEIKTASLTQKYRFDADERLSSQQLLDTTASGGAARVQSLSYDLAGRVIARTGGYGKVEKFAYNAFGKRTESADRLGGKTLIRYDARGNVIDVENAKGAHYGFEYDKADRLVKEVKPLGQTTRYEYDAGGNLLRKTDPLGRLQKYSYDAQNRLTEVQYLGADSSLWQKATFQWQDTLLVAWESWDYLRPEGQQQSSATLSYDEEGRKTGETVSLPNPAGARYSMSYQYGYSAASRKTKIVWPDGTELQYGYAAHGGLERVSIPGTGSLSVGEYQEGVATLWQLPGGGTRTLQIDGLRQLRGQTVKSPTQQTSLQLQNSFGLESELQRRQRTDTLDGATSTDDLTAVHDDDQRLTEVTRKGSFSNETEHFVLDALGNRTAHSRTSGDWTYDANDRLLQQGSGPSAIRYTYDDAGNMVRRESPGRTLDFGYDAENRLIWVRQVDGAWVARYGYDPLGRRLWKEQYRDGAGLPLAQAKRSYYLYADEGLLAEAHQVIALDAEGQVTTSAAPVLHTQYGPQPDAPFTTALLLAKTLDSNAQQQLAFLHNDHLGAPLQATNSKGQLLWAAVYEPFGQATIVSHTPSAEWPVVEINLRLPGQYWDEETGLHYNFRRIYSTVAGRYIQNDPIGLMGGINEYAYVSGKPFSHFDPTGLSALGDAGEIIGCWGGRVAGGAIGEVIFPPGGGFVGAMIGCRAGRRGGRAAGEWLHTKLSPPYQKDAEDDSDAPNFVDTFEAIVDRLRYHNFCDKPPPKTGDKCMDRQRKIDHKKECIAMRQKLEDDHYPQGNPKHQRHIRALVKQLNRLEEIHKEDRRCQERLKGLCK
ncbi:RHS domain-containing protein, partial [Mitsuaria sp. WAJ17]|uniref:RHS repeat-associated core domain-containing protein n=1 Tax=Mitsuaria sp. WAJ17 TaxID=2761452 RepID=UPI0015FF28C7